MKKYQKKILILTTLMSSSCFISCGEKDAKYPTKSTSQQLKDEQQRILGKQIRCEQMISSGGVNGVTKRADCDTGDSILHTGRYLSVFPNDQLSKEAIRSSVDSDGTLYRSPEHLKGNDLFNRASRDVVTGIIYYLVASKDKELGQRLWSSFKRTGFTICVGAEETLALNEQYSFALEDSQNLTTEQTLYYEYNLNRCTLTPQILHFFGRVMEYIGLDRPLESMLPDHIAGAAAYTMALSVPVNYQLALVADQVYLKVLMKDLTQQWSAIGQTIYSRDKNNLWYDYLSNLTSDGNQTRYDNIGKALLPIMNSWPGGKRNAWIWAQGEQKNSIGLDLVFLSKVLDGKVKK